jgi:hypothetical protein
MKFIITSSRTRKVESQYAILAIVMCVAVFLVYVMTTVSMGDEAITVGKSIGDLYESWVTGTVWYEVFGFSALDEPIPPESVYTSLVWGRDLV